MAKANKQGPQKANTPTPANNASTAGQPKPTPSPAQKSKPTGRTNPNRPRVGGTAMPGAKSTQPKEISTSNPQQQQADSYNRTMRRRMEHLGTGPSQGNTVQDQHKKRLEKRRKRIEERRAEVKKVAASGPRKITIGRRNTYFLIAVAVLIVAIIVIAALINGRL
ncbi:MAG TPA: hypothetical protein VFQ36_17820 [Ktedonobacteraceae bacterium]|nr:hypothetical protein [Ktedonobacteraceae bacterium]HEU0002772.1 hypothetical protein [Ktedonobacteraceae bacterium]